nr:hypothetical protein CFP56_25319 [Quercus suber]
MEQEVLNNFQKLQLTKEEADDIVITSVARAELLEECSLSLFRHRLTDHQQNQRAFKNTLKIAWKMGSDLRIVEVGNNVFQLKFGSVCQLEWVERSGPWNFDNNLLLLCRWRKGLTAPNISFTHAPFWVQGWGLPFEYMSEDAGKDIGSRLGKVLEVDKRAGGVVINGNEKGKGVNGGNSAGVEGDRTSFRPGCSVANTSPSALSKDFEVGQETQLEENEICLSLVGEQLKLGEEAMSNDIFKKGGPCNIEPEVSSPVKVNKEVTKEPILNGLSPSLEAEIESISRGK